MPPGARPVKLTFPAVEPGWCSIRADGVLVGTAMADFYLRWTARLWVVAEQRDTGKAGIVERDSLRDLRAELRRRVEEEGPWWA